MNIEGLANEKATISIVDMQGKVIVRSTTSDKSFSINVKQLTAGTYFVRIERNNEAQTFKFITE